MTRPVPSLTRGLLQEALGALGAVIIIATLAAVGWLAAPTVAHALRWLWQAVRA